MKHLLMILLTLLLLTSCRSRKKAMEISEYRSAEVTKIDTNTVISEEKKVLDREKTTQQTDQKEKQNDGDIVIKGKTDSLKDFTFHNVVNGDTLSDIRISGNADFIIKNRWKQTEKKEIKETETEKLNLVQDLARKSVSQSTIKDVAEKIKTKKIDVKSTGFSLPVYVIIGGAVLLLVLLWFGWKKFGGGIMERLKLKR